MDAAAVKFVRFQKTTLIELQRRAAEKAQQILEKQVLMKKGCVCGCGGVGVGIWDLTSMCGSKWRWSGGERRQLLLIFYSGFRVVEPLKNRAVGC